MLKLGLRKAPDPRIEKLTPDALRSLADAIETHDKETGGDGGAVFMSDMTDDEHADYIHREVDGWGDFTKKAETLRPNSDGGNV